MRIWAFIIIVVMWPGEAAWAEDPPVPESVQFSLLCKAMTFDHNLAERCGDTLTFCILYSPRDANSTAAMKRVHEAETSSGIGAVSGLPLVVTEVEFDGGDKWQADVLDKEADVLYFTPMKLPHLRDILEFSRVHQMLTAASLPKHVDSGLSIGVQIEDSKPKFIINAQTAKNEGVAFSASLLKLAHVVNLP